MAQRDARMLRWTIGSFAAVLLVAIVASVQLSTLGVNFGTLIYASPTLWRGHDAALRISAIEPGGLRGVESLAAQLVLRDENGVRWQGSAGGQDFVDVRIPVPEDLGRFPFLDVVVEAAGGVDRFTLTELEATDRPPPIAGRVRSDAALLQESYHPPESGYRIVPYPSIGQTIGSIPNPTTLRITDGGEPAANLRVRSEAPQVDARTDALGLVSFSYTPGLPVGPLRLKLGEAPSITAEVPLKIAKTGIWLDTTPSGFVRPGGTLSVTLRTLPFRGPVHLDVWVGEALLLTTSIRQHERTETLEVVLPEDAEGFVRINAYRNFSAPRDSMVSTLAFAAAAPPEVAAKQAVAVLNKLQGHTDAISAAQNATGRARVRLAELAMTRFVPETAGVPRLRATLASRRAELEQRKDRLRGHVHTLFLLTVALGLALVVARVLLHQARTRRAVQDVVDEGTRAGEELDREGLERLGRIRHTLFIWTTLAGALIGVYAIYVLLTRLYWG